MNEIRQIIAGAKMTEGARKTALAIFEILAKAEAKAHNVPVEEVQDELSFSIYKEMDWEQILLQKQEYLTKKAASEILEFLGLKDYIQLPEKSENFCRIFLSRHTIS